MKIIIKHNGRVLSEYGFDSKSIPNENISIIDNKLTKISKDRIKEIVQFRPSEHADFEYGIGGFVGDEYYKIKDIKLQNNNTEILVKVSKV